MGDAEVIDGMYRDGFLCPLADEMMGATAETLADRYEISPDEAQMRFASETRGFSPVEAASLHKLLDTLAIFYRLRVLRFYGGTIPTPDRTGAPVRALGDLPAPGAPDADGDAHAGPQRRAQVGDGAPAAAQHRYRPGTR